MKRSDIERMKKMSELNLTEWVFNGDHCPMVEVFYHETERVYFQVSFTHMKYRKTKAAESTHEILSYGDWNDLA